MNDLAHLLAGSPLARLLEPPTPEQLRLADEVLRRDDLAAKAARFELLLDIGIPEEHARTIAPGVYEKTLASQYAARWLAGSKLVLLLTGPHDAGKTFAAGLALTVAADRWVSSIHRTPAPVMVAAEHLHKAWMHRDPNTREKTTRANPDTLLHCPLLVIDDVGQEPAALAHITMEALDTILRTRCDAGRRTMLTSNLADADAFLAHVQARGGRGQRVGERLTEYGISRACPVEGFRRRSRGEEGSAT